MPNRVRAVIIQDDKVLTLERKCPDEIFWCFPGGGIEPSDRDEKEALKRECLEEVGVKVEVGEKIFQQNFKGNLEIFYLCEISGGKVAKGSGPEYFSQNHYRGTHQPKWLEIANLGKYDLRPVELRDKVRTRP